VTIPDLQSYPIASATERKPPPLMANPSSLVCENYHLVRELVLTTDYLWLTSSTLLTQDLAEGRLVAVANENLRLSDVEISASWRASRTLSTAATAMIAKVREIFATHNHNHKA
jgi:DNA-binding transcriptional LysR family regulator